MPIYIYSHVYIYAYMYGVTKALVSFLAKPHTLAPFRPSWPEHNLQL